MGLHTVLLAAVCFINVADCHLSSEKIEENKSKAHMTTMEVIRVDGYPAENYTVQTADGYLLGLHRIPHGKRGPSDPKKPPVLFGHGVLSCSSQFLISGPGNSLPYLLADLGFDVWMANFRGNFYSKAHVYLSPEDQSFWNFSLHEPSVYDIPANIDFILDHTKQEKVIYIGYSMGTTLFFMFMSTRPEYNDKVAVALHMGVVGYMKNVKSSVISLLAVFREPIKNFAETVINGELAPRSEARGDLLNLLFGTTVVGRHAFLTQLFTIMGFDYEMFDKSVFDIFFYRFFNGFSAKAINHYGQIEKNEGKFRQYDYGTEGNLKEYGSPEPPCYDLQKITTPLYFYEGKNDYLSSLEDVALLIGQLPAMPNLYVVDYPKFNHIDFVASVDIKRQVYDFLIQDLTSFLGNNTRVCK